VLKIASTAPTASPTAEMMEAFAAHAREVSAGQIAAKLFTDGALGDEETVLRRTREGGVQAAIITLEGLAREIPAVGVLLAPHVMRNDAYADRRLDGPVRKALSQELAAHDLMFGAWGPSELRGWLSHGSALTGADAARGLAHPAPRSRAEQLTAEALGAALTDAPLETLRTGLGRASVRLVAVSPLEAVAAGLERGATHFTVSDHALRASVLIYSRQWFDGLPEDPKRGLSKLPTSLTKNARVALRDLRPTMLGALTARGVQVVESTGKKRRSAARPLRGIANAIARETGAAGARLLRAVRGR
jgi:TRAP-type C4-dicarboxylate transport system substrate-binding protein